MGDVGSPQTGSGSSASTLMTGEVGGIELQWASASDVGRKRTLNEDAYLAQPPIFAVADGMGGHEAGEVASRMAIEELASLARSLVLERDDVEATFQRAHHRIAGAGLSSDKLGMGTTLCGAFLAAGRNGSEWVIAHVGDSRAYRLANGELERLTSDHSLVGELVRAGQISEEQARVHPQRSAITQAIGASDVVVPELSRLQITAGDRLLLCTDGLSTELSDADLKGKLLGSVTPSGAVDEMLARSLSTGGEDNITLIVIDVLSLASKEAKGHIPLNMPGGDE